MFCRLSVDDVVVSADLTCFADNLEACSDTIVSGRGTSVVSRLGEVAGVRVPVPSPFIEVGLLSTFAVVEVE